MKELKITNLGIWIKQGDGSSEYLSAQVKFILDGNLIVKNYLANFNIEGDQEYATNYPKKKKDEHGLTEEQIIIYPVDSKNFLKPESNNYDDEKKIKYVPVNDWHCILCFTFQEEKYKVRVVVHKNINRTKSIQPHFKMKDSYGLQTSLLSTYGDTDISKDGDIIVSEISDISKIFKNEFDLADEDDIPEQEKDDSENPL